METSETLVTASLTLIGRMIDIPSVGALDLTLFSLRIERETWLALNAGILRFAVQAWETAGLTLSSCSRNVGS